ncbi:MAG TPA: Slp family lipoprotein [Xanthomonadaceae bacterium]|nr:Slp family lipoprotein [Xanthomonadaceae bacterium]
MSPSGPHVIRPLALLAPLTLAACVGAPKALQGDFATITPAAPDTALRVGTPVRWGGSILALENLAGGTCLEVLGRPLDHSARPRSEDGPQGPFVACQDRLLDSAVFRKGQEVTVVGRITGLVAPAKDKDSPQHPRLEIESLHLWAEPIPDLVHNWHPRAYIMPGTLAPPSGY